MGFGIKKLGRAMPALSLRKICISSLLTGVLRGAPIACQSGNNSFNAVGSNMAPDNICAPTSEPFSTTQTLISWLCSWASWRSLQALDKPAGPAPTITTSNSIDSRSMIEPLNLSVTIMISSFVLLCSRSLGNIISKNLFLADLFWPFTASHAMKTRQSLCLQFMVVHRSLC